MWLIVRWTLKEKNNTYVSLSSHERHVSFMVPCKSRSRWRSQCEESRQKRETCRLGHRTINVWDATAHCQPPAHIFSPPSPVKTCETKNSSLSAAGINYCARVLIIIIIAVVVNWPFGYVVIFAGFQLTQVYVQSHSVTAKCQPNVRLCSEQTPRGGLIFFVRLY